MFASMKGKIADQIANQRTRFPQNADSLIETLSTTSYACSIFTEEPADDLKCLICLGVAKDPLQHEGCGKMFCKCCIEMYGKEKPCPNCRTETPRYFTNKQAFRAIMLLPCKCFDSCTWEGNVQGYDAHVKVCPHAKADCPKCKVAVLQKDLKTHLKDECEVIKFPCKYIEIGCNAMLKRGEREEHEGDMGIHRPLAIAAITQTKNLITASIRHFNSICQRYNALQRQRSFIFKLRRFNTRREDCAICTFPTFYTRETGYALSLTVFPNGVNSNENTHISALVRVVKGKFDPYLRWPLTCSIKVAVLNQLENSNHRITALRTLPVDQNRGVHGNQLRVGSGCGNHLIRHSELGLNAEQNTQFLRDDCVYFRVTIQLLDRRGWLSNM